MINQLKRHLSLLSAITLLVGIIVVSLPPKHAHAVTQQITERVLTLEAGATDGGSLASGNVKHKFNFKLADTTSNLGSISFQYCTTAAPVSGGVNCIAPAGMNVAASTLINSSGATGFTGLTPSAVCDTLPTCLVNNTITITRTTASPIGGASPAAVMYEFSGIINPSAINTTFFVRIKTYATTNATGAINDAGTVAASTANAIVLNGTMPESLIFCTGRTIAETNNVPDCTTADLSQIYFNQLFTPLGPSYATSQMAASTNAGFGYNITVFGPTMTSGSNTIAAIAGAGGDITKPGTPQFGLTLATDAEANAPPFGATPPSPVSGPITTPAGGATYHAQALAPYNLDDPTADATYVSTYKFVSSDTVADSNSQASDPQVYTVTYMVNVPGSQPAGDYKSTLTYICTAKF